MTPAPPLFGVVLLSSVNNVVEFDAFDAFNDLSCGSFLLISSDFSLANLKTSISSEASSTLLKSNGLLLDLAFACSDFSLASWYISFVQLKLTAGIEDKQLDKSAVIILADSLAT
ncbi:unnamed protein product [[Candida] boidinii]|nr:unnamed protein product [[Candida] boidinii]